VAEGHQPSFLTHSEPFRTRRQSALLAQSGTGARPSQKEKRLPSVPTAQPQLGFAPGLG
jgi:hypothetical protein